MEDFHGAAVWSVEVEKDFQRGLFAHMKYVFFMHEFPLHLVDCILSQHQWPAPILALPLIRYRGNDDVAKSQS